MSMDDRMYRRRRRLLKTCTWDQDLVEGGIVEVVDWNKAMVMVRVQITPTEGVFAEHRPTLTFVIMVHEDFPESCPQVICCSPVYHPNIDPTIKQMRNVFSPLLDEQWRADMGFLDVCKILMHILYHPHFESASSPFFEDRTLSEDEYERNLLLALNAQVIGYCDFFARNKLDKEEEWGDGWTRPGDAREYWQKTRNVDHDGRLRHGDDDDHRDNDSEDDRYGRDECNVEEPNEEPEPRDLDVPEAEPEPDPEPEPEAEAEAPSRPVCEG